MAVIALRISAVIEPEAVAYVIPVIAPALITPPLVLFIPPLILAPPAATFNPLLAVNNPLEVTVPPAVVNMFPVVDNVPFSFIVNVGVPFD